MSTAQTPNTGGEPKAKRGLPPPIRITDAAAKRINEVVAKAAKPVLGVRVGVSNKGCSGKSYVVEYAEDQRKFEDVVEHNGAKVFIDPKAVMYLLGSELDYRESKMESGFVFTNPNEKGRCGCGESFSI
ncbi:MAG: iron-sulfur cluster assembly accessory protein [Rhodospirillaceae bacterium]|nr:iron-sulfur cluster assembly accessory protein [Rhodospirillaceae bacterium]